MSPIALSAAVAAAAFVVSGVAAQQSTFPATPLAQKRFSYPTGIPYKADSDVGLIRGEQSGYNICNSTTENQGSLCQTSFINGIDDFCLWAPMKVNSTIADTEGEEVAWCTKPGRGTRLIPAGALQGVQFMRTPDYIQAVGFIDQAMINIQTDDFGGELDPHGADLRGNPMGGLLYTQQFNTPSGQWTQVIEWHNFMGGNMFCFKACDPAGAHAADYCQHVFDRIGCAYNAPNNAQKGTFESCQGDNQDFPGSLHRQRTGYDLQPTSRVPRSYHLDSLSTQSSRQFELHAVHEFQFVHGSCEREAFRYGFGYGCRQCKRYWFWKQWHWQAIRNAVFVWIAEYRR
ncbi:hypothetical protein AAF712_013473 [Marasmius tenuissimus]|uniref:Macrofage activating glycoprotein n=1 Tax=Marasmius tenuissimus TaxID=585030 RepID=A0ABR2ZDX0_9AGAR